MEGITSMPRITSTPRNTSTFRNKRPVQFHVRCFQIWDEERPRVRVEYDAAIKKWREDSDKQRAAGGLSQNPGGPCRPLG